ncbi:hypothetical protein SeMB42_g04901 [Synchytrium endobioticum]|nr:hypothetical protein SeMB42_g04901 [Synchytrium endobioticum]TPX44506.1 hypothetical protein SeLEV6574_g04460 [Synchytrium endobioticum]
MDVDPKDAGMDAAANAMLRCKPPRAPAPLRTRCADVLKADGFVSYIDNELARLRKSDVASQGSESMLLMLASVAVMRFMPIQ